MDEPSFYDAFFLAWLAMAGLACASLFFITAPYGRHARVHRWTIDRTAGWVLMELPAPLGMMFWYLAGDRRGLAATTFLVAWLAHYMNRTFVFPFRMRGGQGRMPVPIVASGFAFNLGNSYLQGRWLFSLGPEHDATWLADPRFIIGLLIFAGGMALNLRADAALRRLREADESGYRIPRGGAFRWVSCPNYLGEMIEWTGWAILTWSRAGLLFAVWTAANLVPRALSHHRWYRAQFRDYPAKRKAILPFVL